MIITVTGCGPTLNKYHVPKNSFVIGVNRSYEIITPDIICTADPDAYKHISSIRKEPILFNHWNFIRNVPDFFIDKSKEQIKMDKLFPELIIKNSGAFAIWIASLFSPKKVYLIGFGGVGHFYNLSTKYENEIFIRNAKSVANALTYLNCPILQYN